MQKREKEHPTEEKMETKHLKLDSVKSLKRQQRQCRYKPHACIRKNIRNIRSVKSNHQAYSQKRRTIYFVN